jgi:phenylacetate-CoA ligase
MINLKKITIKTGLKLTNSKLLKTVDKFDNISYWSKEKIKKYQQKKLNQLLLHAYKNVPYYKNLLTVKKIVKNNKVYLKNFTKLPYLTKNIIQKQGKNLVSKDANRRGLFKNTSGGSTGKPVKLIQDKRYWFINGIINKIYFNKILGKKIGDPEINIWGSEKDINRNILTLKNQIINFFYNRTFLNAFKVNNKKLNEFVKNINKHKPKVIWTYVESIDLLAKFIKKNNLSVYSPDFIISTAGVLYPEIRNNVERVFRCPVYNQYGSREVGPLAIECKYKKGLHIFPWSHYIEVVKKQIIVTVLTNYSMPLIRYKIGDLGIKAKKEVCKCGRNTLFFKKIFGRESQYFINSNGNKVYGEYFTHLLYFKPWVKQFQIVQEQINLINFLIIKNKKPKKEDLIYITKKVKQIMGKNCQVNFIYKKRLNKLKSGKFLYTMCKLK